MSSIVQNYIHDMRGDITSFLYLPQDPVPPNIPLKINHILRHNHNLDRYILNHPNGINDFQLLSLRRMLQCDSGGCGGTTYACRSCGEWLFIPFYCHSRVCSRCGKLYAAQWGKALTERILEVPHRHIIWTLPGPLWPLIGENPAVYVNDMFQASKKVIERIFAEAFQKLSKLYVGMIAVIHFTGRDLKYNPHIHMLVTEGCITPDGEWHKCYYFPYKKLNSYWKYEVLTRLRLHSRDSLEKKSLIDAQFKRRFANNGENGYVVKNYRDVLDMKEFGSYLARYVRHPPIGESRILGYNGVTVTIKYEWDNKLFITDVSIEQFISSIISNIPPKGFCEVRYYGMYSPSVYCLAKVSVSSCGFIQTELVLAYEHVVCCPKCHSKMYVIMIEYYQPALGVMKRVFK